MLEHSEASLTPLMKQYVRIKAEYTDSLVLFQVGDFYELFFDDAKSAAGYLGIALTKRGKVSGQAIPLCGVPVHALDHYLIKLVKGGFKIAIVDQLEEAVPGKVVYRGVTRVLTPGTLTDDKLLDAQSASYIFSFFPVKDQLGMIFGELLTAQLFATVVPEGSLKQLESELSRFFPDEIILPDMPSITTYTQHFKALGYFTTLVDVADQAAQSQTWIRQQFDQEIHESLQHNNALALALQTLYAYLSKNQQQSLRLFKSIQFYKPDDFLLLDAATQKNLELVKNNNDGTRNHTLLQVIDKAQTAMGSRMLKKWLLKPLINKEAIEQRQEALAAAINNIPFMQQLQKILKQMGDIERVVGRVALRRASLNDYLLLLQGLQALPEIQCCLTDQNTALLFHSYASQIEDFDSIKKLLESSLNDDVHKQWFIKQGFDKNLDSVRELVETAATKIMNLELQEQQKTGINSLKIRYNQVYGYYIEITKTHSDSVPDYYRRQQTLIGKERYMIAELADLQHEITTAQHQISSLEKDIFENIKQAVEQRVSSLRKMAHAIASLDALISLAWVAYTNSYIRPIINDRAELIIQAGRHPVVEQQLTHSFHANDCTLNDQQSLLIITGPNMGGKSTYLRQNALIALLAHIGSFVPASFASIMVLDRIFTRIGAGDNLAEGKSTFLVEMEETAAICNFATERSLVILDEVGRGTSTFDGISIAQAVIEYIFTVVKAKCLFATHYHELTALQDQFSGIACYYAASKKTENGILFLHTMRSGTADGSFGIEVAKLAQLPSVIVQRSQLLYEQMVNNQRTAQITALSVHGSGTDYKDLYYHTKQQLEIKEQQLSILQKIDYNELSPRQAFDILWHLKS